MTPFPPSTPAGGGLLRCPAAGLLPRTSGAQPAAEDRLLGKSCHPMSPDLPNPTPSHPYLPQGVCRPPDAAPPCPSITSRAAGCPPRPYFASPKPRRPVTIPIFFFSDRHRIPSPLAGTKSGRSSPGRTRDRPSGPIGAGPRAMVPQGWARAWRARP